MTRTERLFSAHAARNMLHTVLLLGGMFALCAVFGSYLLGGWSGVLIVGLVGLVSVGFGARMSPQLVLRMYRAQPLAPRQAPQLHAMLGELAQRAGLGAAPQPYYVPSRMINAFAVGSPERAAIGITDGMLRALSAREVRGVVAHEVTHVANNDAWVMSLADFVTRAVNMFSWMGQVTLLLSLPSVLTGGPAIFPLHVLLLMIFAPTLSAMLQLALSRAREHAADVGAARLTGDPRGLASALAKMERVQGGMLERFFLPGRRVPEPSLLRTHPSTDERVRRLLAMEREIARAAAPAAEPLFDPRHFAAPARQPRWHVTGTWY